MMVYYSIYWDNGKSNGNYCSILGLFLKTGALRDPRPGDKYGTAKTCLRLLHIFPYPPVSHQSGVREFCSVGDYRHSRSLTP